MHVKFNSGSRRLFSAGLCFAASGLYLATVARHFIAYQLSTEPDLGSLSRAAEIEPWNAELRWKLGRYALFVAQNPTLAVSNLESAVALNPHLARYWLDLAAGYQLIDDVQRQRSALDRALRADPTAPNMAWAAANFYLARKERDRALPRFRVVMANDPKKTNSSLKLCWHATQNVS